MASLPPLGGGSPPGPGSGLKARSRSSARDDEPAREASKAQREASKQIEAANKSVEEARRDADIQIDQIHDNYDARSEVEYAREEAAFQNERLKGYERLKDLKRTQEKELTRTRKEGDRELEKINNYFRDTQYSAARTGDEKLRELEMQQARSYEHARKLKEGDAAFVQDQSTRQAAEIRAENDEKIAGLQEEARRQYEQVRETTSQATDKARESFESKYQGKLKENDRQLREIYARSSSDLKHARRDTTDKLAAYSSRQRDPFYRMQDMNVRVADEGDYYELTARIPEHEQKHVSVSVKGNQLVLSGSRRAEEKLDIAPGRTQSTNAFQSFQETFPIAWPVEANKLTREFDGDQLTVRVPKKNDYAYKPRTEAKVPARAKLERPQFPENLPHVSQDPYANTETTSDEDRPRKPDRPLG